VAGVRLAEAVGIDTGADEVSRPQSNRLCGQLERRRLAVQENVAEVAKEDPMPGLQFAQQRRRCRVAGERPAAAGARWGSGIARWIALGPDCGTVRHHPRPWSKYSDYSGKPRLRKGDRDAKLALSLTRGDVQ
jgi:hypothetical protein